MVAWVALAFGTACQSTPQAPDDAEVEAGLRRSERYLNDTRGHAVGPGTPPPAAVGGVEVTWGELTPLLVEAAGAQVLDEVILDRALAERAAQAGVTVGEQDVIAERRLLIESLESQRAPGEAGLRGEELLQRVRADRGLGDLRFAALLRRTATLRALVRDRAQVSEQEYRDALEVRFGQRWRARVITVPDARAAERIGERLAAGEDFSRLAAEESTDASAARGGVIEPVSVADPDYPAALRSALRAMQPGETSGAITVESGYAIVRLDEVIAARAFDEAAERDRVMRELRTVRERALMSELASELRRSARVVVFDPGLARAREAR